MTTRRTQPWFSFGLAVATVAAAAGVNFLVQPLEAGRAPFLPFFPALILTAFYGGFAAGLAAVALSMLAVDFFWIEPAWQFRVSNIGDVVALFVFASAGSAVVAISSRLRQRGAEALQARADLQTITDIMASGVARYSRDLRYMWASKHYLEMRGRSADQVIGLSMQQVLGAAGFEAVRPYIYRVLAGESVLFEQEAELANRGRGWISLSYTPQRDGHGAIESWVGVVTDITHRKRLEESLRQADRRKDEFLATLAHELRNPLAPIRYCAKLLQLDVSRQTLQHARETIERQGTHMKRLLDDLLDVSRITRNVIELQLEPLDLRESVEEALEIARPLIDKAHHRLAVSVAGAAVWVTGDRTRVAQIIGNLLQNAAKYTGPGGSIEVRLEVDAGYGVIRIEDNGIGIPPEKRGEVFELFSQIHSSHSSRSGGLGIGLAVVKNLVELHHGWVSLENGAQGQGSEFSVGFPLSAPPVSERASNLTQLHGHDRRILVVDDNTDVAESLAAFLRFSGYLVHTATDGPGALRLAETIHPDVVVLDLGMPKMGGHEVARAVRRQPWGTRVQLIAATGWGSAADRRGTQEVGFDAHLTKPLDPDELIRLIESAPKQEQPAVRASAD
jgi:PAS domain S-box-containing protein